MMIKIYTVAVMSLMALVASAGPSILDVKHTKTDDNIVPPESFEIKTQELQENFYLKNYGVGAAQGNISEAKFGNPKEYEELLSRLPTEIEMPYNPIVGKYIEMYLGKRRDLVSNMLSLHNNYYGDIFIEELEREGLPLELQYLPVIESAMNPNAVSRAGAAGLWQFMPSTATGLGMEVNSLVDERRDPRVSSRYAAVYLKQLYNIYNDWSLAIAAYNCGPGNVNKALRRAGGGKKDYWEIYDYLLSETRGYVPTFIAANYVMNYHNRYGIKPVVMKSKLVVDTVQINKRVHFNQISSVLDIPIEEIRMLNPQFRKDIIPGDNHPYNLVLPSQQCVSYIMSENEILAYDADKYSRRSYVEPGAPRPENGFDNQIAADGQTQNADTNIDINTAVPDSVVRKIHIVRRGENLRDIARLYGVSATDVKRWNNLRRGKVKEGDELVIEVYEKVLANASTVPTAPTTVTKQVADKPAKTVSSANNSSANNKSRKKTSTSSKHGSRTKTTTYKVKNGDSLDKIARKYGTTVAAIREANGMGKKTSKIVPGQKLKIPSASKSGSKKKSRRRRR